MKLRISACTIIFIAFVLQLAAQHSLSDSVPLNPAVKHGRLKNGFHYYILNEPQPDKKISFNLVVKVGYPDERPDQVGISHLIEHIGTRSTEKFPEGTFNFLKKHNMLGTGNASTGNITHYFFRVDETKKELLNPGLRILRDIAANVSFLPSEIEEEREAVAREMSNGTSRSFFVSNEIEDQLLGNVIPYDKTNSLNVRTAREVSIDTIKRFYKYWYQPANQAVIILGNLNVVKVEQEIKALFSDLRNEHVLRRRLGKEDHQIEVGGKKNRLIVVEDDPGSSIVLQVYVMRKSQANVSHPATMNEFRMLVMNELVNDMIINRLKVLTVNESPAVQAMTQSMQREAIKVSSGLDAFWARTTLASTVEIKPVLAFIVREMKRLKEYGFSKPEQERAVASYLNRFENSLPSESMLVSHFEYGSAVPANGLQLKKDLAKTIGLQEINQMVAEFLNQLENVAIALTIPSGTRSQLPSESSVFNWINEFWNSDMTPYVQNSVKEPVLPVFQGSNQRRYAVREISSLDATEVVLDNGIKVILKTLREDSGNGFDILLRGLKPCQCMGLEREVEALIQNPGDFIAVGSLSPTEFSSWKEYQNDIGSPISTNPYIKSNEAGIVGTALRDNAETLLRLINAYFTNASLDREAFQRGIEAIIVKSGKKKKKATLFEDSIQSVVNNKREFDSGIVNIASADQAFNICKKNFTSADGYSFIITGSFDKETMISLVARYLGSLPVSNHKAVSSLQNRNTSRSATPRTSRRKTIMVGDSIGNVDVRMVFRGPSESTVVDRLQLSLLREIIGQKLFARLREKDKGVYSVSAEIQSGRNGNDYYLDIGFQTAPADVTRLVKSVEDELSRLSNGELEDSIFQGAMARVRERVARDMQRPFFWDEYLAAQIRQGRFSDDGMRRLELLESITPKDVVQAMSKFFNLKDYSLFELL
jgi:zinc protease